MCMLAGEQLASVEPDDVATAEVNERIEAMIAAAGVPTEPARRSLVPE